MQLKTHFLLAACLTMACSLPAFAHQTRGGQGTGQQAGRGTMQQDHLHTQDRLHTPDQDRDRLRDHDRTHDSNNQIYGYSLMTSSERRQYRKQIRKLKTLQERNQYRQEHMTQMQDRARERGVTLPGMNGQGSGNGGTQ